MNGENVLKFSGHEENHTSSRSKYLSLQKWCSTDTDIAVLGDALTHFQISDVLFRGLHGRKFDCQPL